MTALPESDATTSLVLKRLESKTRRMASATAPASMMAPSTMVSGGTGSLANADDAIPLARRFQFNRLDRTRSDVEADDRLRLSEQRHVHV